MCCHELSLPEAYLHLHLDSNRCFFVYPHDLPLLRKIEEYLVMDRLPKLTPTSPLETGFTELKSRLKHGWPASASPKARNSVTDAVSGRLVKEKKDYETRKHNTWFNVCTFSCQLSQPRVLIVCLYLQSPTFEGCFPSRITDFLYLGNLNHASNPHMLHALGSSLF